MSEVSAASLGTRIVRAALTRLHRSEPIAADFVLLASDRLLADLAPRIDVAGRFWRPAPVTGEVTLRGALHGAKEPVVAVVPSEARLPRDLVERAYLRRVLRVRADDVVAAVGRRECDPVLDDDVAQAVFQCAHQLESLLDSASLGPRLRLADVRALLVAADLGSPLRLTQRSPEQWLAEWLVRGAPKPARPAMLCDALRESLGRQGGALAWAVEHGVEGLLARGALAGTPKGLGLLPKSPPPPDLGDAEVRTLVERAVQVADLAARLRVTEALGACEALAHRARWTPAEAQEHPLLMACLDQALAAAGDALKNGQTLEDAGFSALQTHRGAEQRRAELALVRAAARVRRGVDAVRQPPTRSPWQAWFDPALAIGALDLAIRELRYALLACHGALAASGDSVLTLALAFRDEWNRAFAATLALSWSAVTGANDPAGPVTLHHVGRSVLRPLLDAGQRVYLAVLDGCDVATAIELARDLTQHGLAPVPLRAGADAIGEALRRRPVLGMGISLIPTVTSHARRALMLGDIPGAQPLDQAEDAVRNASNDRLALQQNTALQPFAKRLFLKADLQENASGLCAVLANPGEMRLVVAVWNGIDDALASHETTPLGPWRFSDLGPGALESLRQAVDGGWTVLLTADHGHTPFVSSGRKVLTSAASQRFHAEPTAGSVAFEHGPLPTTAVHTLVDTGAWHGTQRKGFHGGAGYEEVVVPLFAIGKVTGAAEVPLPDWWWGAGPVERPPEPAPGVYELVAPRSAIAAHLIDDTDSGPETRSWRAAVTTDRGRQALEHLESQQVLTAAQLGRLLGVPTFMVQGLMATQLRQLTAALGRGPFEIRDQDSEVAYAWVQQAPR